MDRPIEPGIEAQLANLRQQALSAGDAEVVRSADRLLDWIKRRATTEGWRTRPELVSIGEAIKLTGRSRNTIKRWVDRELLTGFRNPTNGELFVPRDQLMKLVNLSTTRPPSRYQIPRTASNRDRHREAEARSLHLHRQIAELIKRDPSAITRALDRVQGWLDGSERFSGSRSYAERWYQLLTGPRSTLRRVLTTDDESSRALRQASPFAGLLSQEELLGSLSRTGSAVD